MFAKKIKIIFPGDFKHYLVHVVLMPSYHNPVTSQRVPTLLLNNDNDGILCEVTASARMYSAVISCVQDAASLSFKGPQKSLHII